MENLLNYHAIAKASKMIIMAGHPNTSDIEALNAIRKAYTYMDSTGISPKETLKTGGAFLAFDEAKREFENRVAELEEALDQQQQIYDDLVRKAGHNATDEEQLSAPLRPTVDEIVASLKDVDRYSTETDEIGNKRAYRSLAVVYEIIRLWDDLGDEKREQIIEQSGQAKAINRLKIADTPAIISYMAWPGNTDPRKRNRAYWINAMRAALQDGIDSDGFVAWIEEQGGIKKAADRGRVGSSRRHIDDESSGELGSLEPVKAARSIGKRLAKAKADDLEPLFDELAAVLGR
ncbi:hypothetical protein [Azospirillum humicireducens]|uniref:hypothetical protein n=1 Tax=Azospirillum humicireducens TaxID=1226968 RepID=UPI0007C0EB83|nr:hypothetical protein [Azospirillum humicireducens]